jgi:hypothetical protein
LLNEFSAEIKHFCGVPSGENGRADYLEATINSSGDISQVGGISTLEEMTPPCIHMPGLEMAMIKGQNKDFSYSAGTPEYGVICATLFGAYDPGKFSGHQTIRAILKKAHARDRISLVEVCKFSQRR